jgi:hypothetical protein
LIESIGLLIELSIDLAGFEPWLRRRPREHGCPDMGLVSSAQPALTCRTARRQLKG